MIVLNLHPPLIVAAIFVLFSFSCGVSFLSVGKSSIWISVLEVINFIYDLFEAIKMYSSSADYITECV